MRRIEKNATKIVENQKWYHLWLKSLIQFLRKISFEMFTNRVHVELKKILLKIFLNFSTYTAVYTAVVPNQGAVSWSQGAANSYSSLIFISNKPARGATK